MLKNYKTVIFDLVTTAGPAGLLICLAETSGKSKEDIQEAYDSFIEEHPEGRMGKKKFKELMSEAHGKKKDKELLDGVFRVYDDNKVYIILDTSSIRNIAL